MKNLVKFLATGVYLGLLPRAPGTFGSLGALSIAYILLTSFSLVHYMIATFVFVLFAILICKLYEAFFNKHDAKEVVIDEVAGILITMVGLPITWQSFVLGFLLFRLFDIWKPFPISWMDKNIKGGVGVVADDLVAGIFSSFILQIVYTNTPWLGVQLVG